MRGSRFSEEQIIGVLREHEGRGQDRRGLPPTGDLERDLLHLWTAPPWQEGPGPGLAVIDCKHLFGVTT